MLHAGWSGCMKPWVVRLYETLGGPVMLHAGWSVCMKHWMVVQPCCTLGGSVMLHAGWSGCMKHRVVQLYETLGGPVL